MAEPWKAGRPSSFCFYTTAAAVADRDASAALLSLRIDRSHRPQRGRVGAGYVSLAAEYSCLAVSSRTREVLTMKVSANPPDRISLELSDAKGSKVSLGLDRHQAFALMGMIAHGVNSLPVDPVAPLHRQRAALRSTNPSLQVGVGDGGNVVLSIVPAPFPPLEFHFDAQALTKLIADLRKAATVPSQSKGRAN